MAAYPTLPAVRAADRPPRLVLRFAVFTALGLAIAGALIMLVVREADTLQARQHAVDHARFATEAVLNQRLRARDLAAPVPAGRSRELDGYMRTSVLRSGIRRATLYRSDGRATYTTGDGAARRAPARHLRDALSGMVVSEIVAEDGARRSLRTYVPVVLGPKRMTGVAAFEQDYAPIAAAGRSSSWLIAGVLEALLLLLFLIFMPVLVRVTSRIRRQIAEIEHAATHDELTGAANRVALRLAVDDRLASDDPSGTLVLIDIDGFSELNHVFGSDGGDTLLAEVALRLRWELAGGDLVARLGDDEFGALLDVATPSEIAAVASRVQAYLAPPVLVDGVRVGVSVSIGAAILGEHGSDFATALKHAGAALAVAKSAGRGEVRVYEAGQDAPDVSRITLLSELREALESEQLLVHYQPQADLMTRQVRGVEALLRWQHPTRGLLTAHEFISDAERSGVAKELRAFVLESSARQWRTWWADHGMNLELSVNLSAVDIHDVALPDEIAALLERHAIPPWNLVLEVTERMLVGDERRAGEVIDRLRELGVRLAIDDFGVGYSSLVSLTRFPVQVVKLDRSLLTNVPGEPAAEAVLSGSVKMAHAVGATVVAEGVETSEQWDFVYALGCDIAQGYLLGRPVPGDEIPDLLLEAPAVTPLVAA